MELRTVKTFKVVAEQLKLTRAGDILGYTQPTIIVQMQASEREVGHPLFTKIRYKTFLTSGKVVKQQSTHFRRWISNSANRWSTWNFTNSSTRILCL